MLKTNSAKARENLRRYILDHFTPEDYTDTPPETWPGIAAFILETFRSEYYSESYYTAHNIPEGKAFDDWARGLPSVLNCCYWYNRPAVDDLSDVLEQATEERGRYTEDVAGKLLTELIYRELLAGARKTA